VKYPKIPKYMYAPVAAVNRYCLNTVCKALQIEAALYKDSGRRDAAAALRTVAGCLKRVADGDISMAEVFDWRSPDVNESHTKGNK